ncbi:hypothetical protein GCM10027074_53510 [Streptomyces deserti]
MALHTDGLVDVPGTDAARATTDLAACLAATDDADPECRADSLVRAAALTGRHVDGITLLLLRTRPA